MYARFTQSLLVGIVAAVNPCGFVMLPTYLMYYLGLEGSRPGTQRASVQRALLVSSATSAGFVSVFIVIGTISRLFTSYIQEHAKYAGLVVGVALVVLGCFMLAGWKPRFASPQLGASKERKQTFASMFGFGVAYAVASIGCTIGPLVSTVFGSFATNGYLAGVVSIALYGVGMALIITALTVTLAFASGGLLKFLRNGLQYMDRIAAGFVILTGLYLAWYWYGAISDHSTATRLDSWNDRLNDFLNNVGGWKLAGIFVVVIAAGIAYIVLSRRDDHQADA
ncbi:MAG TPA: cytochrome c biogenesis protein CcdA [Ilumatobacteraceae bacterium]|jgi:cytochrome c biogenesis protein CcdA